MENEDDDNAEEDLVYLNDIDVNFDLKVNKYTNILGIFVQFLQKF